MKQLKNYIYCNHYFKSKLSFSGFLESTTVSYNNLLHNKRNSCYPSKVTPISYISPFKIQQKSFLFRHRPVSKWELHVFSQEPIWF